MKRLFVLITAVVMTCVGCSQQTSGFARMEDGGVSVLGDDCFELQDGEGVRDRGVTKSDLGPNMAVIVSIEFGCLQDGIGANIKFAATSSEIRYGFTSDVLTRDYTLAVDPSGPTLSSKWVQISGKEQLAKSGFLTIKFWAEAMPANGRQPYDERTIVISLKQ